MRIHGVAGLKFVVHDSRAATRMDSGSSLIDGIVILRSIDDVLQL